MVNAFVFIRSATKEGTRRVGALTKIKTSGVRYVSSLSGQFDAIVAIEAPSLEALEKTVTTKIRGRGIDRTLTYIVVPLPPPPPMPVWARPPKVLVFTRCWVESGAAAAVLSSLKKLPNFIGAAAVAGDFDILFEAGADQIEDLFPTLEKLHRVTGLRSSSSAFSSGPHNWRPPAA
ncbi:MAG: hypothetical protein ACYDCC_16295 [Actinomycetota bacterium]